MYGNLSLNNTIEITKETIRTKNKTFTIKNINNVSYDEEVLSLSSIGFPILIFSTMIYFFISAILAFIIGIIAIGISFVKLKKYVITINGNKNNTLTTFDEKEYNYLRKNIEDAIENYNTEKKSNKKSEPKYTEEVKEKATFKYRENTYKKEERNQKPFENNQNNINSNKRKFTPYTDDEKKAYAERMKELKQKGSEYEEFVAGYYKLDGYEVNLHGIKKGKKDKGIDIICTKDEELILIQCKNWKEDSKYKINHEKLKAFVGCCTEYVNENKLFDKNIKLKFITSNYILDESGKKFLQESKTLQYEILKY
jgi:Holliday junction resolvase